MFYGILADIIGLVHLGYVSFVVFGQLLILIGIARRWGWVRNLKFRVIHLLMILVVALESLGEIMCPLTTWEKNLRVLAGQPPSGDSFVADFLNRVLFFDCGIAYDHWIFKSAYVSFAALVIMTFVIAPPRRRANPGSLDVSPNTFATALLTTIAFVMLYTAACMEEQLMIYATAFTGIHFAGLALLSWGLRRPSANP